MQGGECFGYFMQWGLPKAMLKKIWEVVAGDEGRLTQRQFVSCIYLMERAKRGAPLPQRLPPGPFPPIAEPDPNTGPQQQPVSLSAGIQAVWPQDHFVVAMQGRVLEMAHFGVASPHVLPCDLCCPRFGTMDQTWARHVIWGLLWKPLPRRIAPCLQVLSIYSLDCIFPSCFDPTWHVP